jgi:hypothetical protein
MEGSAMRRIFLTLIMFGAVSLMAEGAFFDFAMGPDWAVKDVQNSRMPNARFLMNLEVGGKHIGFTLQPSFGDGVTSIYLGPRLMMPIQIGDRPLFVVPDISIGPDFSFTNGIVGFTADMQFGFRIFYEIQDGFGISFRPFGMTIRPFNVWFGDTPNQVQIAVRYEMLFGFTYFF